MKSFFNKYAVVFFVLLLLACSWAYDYHEIVAKRPQSYHTWRQTDCTSLALTYYQKDEPLFAPSLHNLHGNEGKSIGELPIIYYVVGKLYKVFGPRESIFRIVNTLIFFLGLFYIFRLGNLLFDDLWYSLAMVAIAFSSPLVVFYAPNFLPDVPALSLTYIAWYYIAVYLKTKELKKWIVALFFFTVAALLKTTALLSLCVIVVLLAYELIFVPRARRVFFSEGIGTYFMTFIPFVVYALWLVYGHYYQVANDNFYFSLDWDPIWLEEAETRKYIWHRLIKGWWPDMYLQLTMIVAGASLLFCFSPKVSYFWRITILAYLAGVACFIILFFSALKDHDYYLILGLSIIPFLFFFLFVQLKHTFLFKNWIFKMLVGVFIFLNIQHTDRRMHYRYAENLNGNLIQLYEIEPFLTEIGIKKEDKVLFDGSPMWSGAHYFMNRYGWNNAYEKFTEKSDLVAYAKEKDAQYLVVLGEENSQKIAYQSLSLLTKREDVYIYKLW